jgi:solute carrier family 25 carnitine/acylcarnitine transporter 20/29
LTALYAGITGPILTIGVIQSLNFAIYDSVRRVLYQRQLRSKHGGNVGHGLPDDYLHYDNLQNVAMASFISGAATSIFTSPVTLVKTKQQLMQWSFRKTIQDTWSRGNARLGLQNFYAGYGIHLCCDAFGRSLYMLTYEYLKRELSEGQHTTNNNIGVDINRASSANLSIPQRMICAASAGMACWAFIFPADVIRSRLYSQSINSQSLPSTMDGIRLAKQMVKEDGIRSLYRGISITVARAGPVAAAILPVYDYVLDKLS